MLNNANMTSPPDHARRRGVLGHQNPQGESAGNCSCFLKHAGWGSIGLVHGEGGKKGRVNAKNDERNLKKGKDVFCCLFFRSSQKKIAQKKKKQKHVAPSNSLSFFLHSLVFPRYGVDRSAAHCRIMGQPACEAQRANVNSHFRSLSFCSISFVAIFAA